MIGFFQLHVIQNDGEGSGVIDLGLNFDSMLAREPGKCHFSEPVFSDIR